MWIWLLVLLGGKIPNQPELLQLLNALFFIFVIQSRTLLTKLVFYFYNKSSKIWYCLMYHFVVRYPKKPLSCSIDH